MRKMAGGDIVLKPLFVLWLEVEGLYQSNKANSHLAPNCKIDHPKNSILPVTDWVDVKLKLFLETSIPLQSYKFTQSFTPKPNSLWSLIFSLFTILFLVWIWFDWVVLFLLLTKS